MVQDPYKVLGLSQGASQDEIKKAYRKKAKENHPDLHPDDPRATEKMNEINEAYDMLMNPSKYQQRREQEQAREQARQSYQSYYGGGSSGGSAYGGQQGAYSTWSTFDFDDFFGFGGGRQQQSYGGTSHQAGETETVRQAVDAINSHQYQQACIYLNGVLSSNRNARWYYLYALAQNGMGNTVQAVDNIRRAVQMDPNNLEYRRAMQQMQQEGQSYQQRGQAWGGGTDMSRWCMTLCAANLLCSMCGRGGFFCC